MKKPIIAIDIDEVLFPLHEPFLLHHNQQYGTKFSYPDRQGRYYMQEFTGEDETVMVEKLRRYYASGETRHLQPLPGAAAAVKRLQQNFDLIVLSNQQLFQGEYTRAAIQQEFGDVFRKIYITGSLPSNHAVTKAMLCKKYVVDTLSDDNAATAINCAAEGINVILFGDYHWNKLDDLPAKVTRCKDWAAVLEYFDAP